MIEEPGLPPNPGCCAACAFDYKEWKRHKRAWENDPDRLAEEKRLTLRELVKQQQEGS